MGAKKKKGGNARIGVEIMCGSDGSPGLDGSGSEFFVFSFQFPDMDEALQLEIELIPDDDKPGGKKGDGDNTPDAMDKAAKAVGGAVKSGKLSKKNAEKITISNKVVPAGVQNKKPRFRYLGLIEFKGVLSLDFGSSAGKIHAYGMRGGAGGVGGRGGVKFKKPKGKWRRPKGQGDRKAYAWRYDPADKSQKGGKYKPFHDPEGWEPVPIPLGQRGRMIVQVDTAVVASTEPGSGELFEIPFRYQYDSPEAQLAELSWRLSAAGFAHSIGPDGVTPLMHRLSGRPVVAFGISLAGTVRTPGLPFPWITVCGIRQEPRGADVKASHGAPQADVPPARWDESAVDLLLGLDHFSGAPQLVGDVRSVVAADVGDDALQVAHWDVHKPRTASQEFLWLPVYPPATD